MEVVHSLVPNGQFGAWYVVSGGPAVGLTLNENFFVRAAKIKSVQFLLCTNANRDGMTELQVNVLTCKAILRQELKVSSNM